MLWLYTPLSILFTGILNDILGPLQSKGEWKVLFDKYLTKMDA